MLEFITILAQHFPLKAKVCRWNNVDFHIRGKNWSFNTCSGWRLVTPNGVGYGMEDNKAKHITKQLRGKRIVGLEIQSNHLALDPVFVFSNGYKIEIFSNLCFDSWICVPHDRIWYTGELGYEIPHSPFILQNANKQLNDKLTNSKLAQFIKHLSSRFPLKIDKVIEADSGLFIIGKDWNFHTEGAWRVITDTYVMHADSYDYYIKDFVKQLYGLSIIGMSIQSRHLCVDPVFHLSNGYKIEIFSFARSSTWSFQALSDIQYTSSLEESQELASIC